jgi:hypothetical protein
MWIKKIQRTKEVVLASATWNIEITKVVYYSKQELLTKLLQADGHKIEFELFKEESSISNPDFNNVTVCYIFNMADGSRNCINLGDSLNGGSIYSKCVDFQNPGACGLTGGWECAVDVGQDFTDMRVKDSCAGQVIGVKNGQFRNLTSFRYICDTRSQ